MITWIRKLLGQKLHVWSNDCDSVIAWSLRDAGRVLDEMGYGDIDPELFERVPDSEEISIHCDEDGDPTEPESDDDAGLRTLTAGEWCALRGRGFLCTTEF